MKFLRTFAENTYVKLAAGLTLLGTALAELITEAESGVQTEHGVMLFAVIHILKVLPELQHGADEISSLR